MGAEQGGTHHIPSSDFIAGDSLELRRSNQAEWGQMATEVPGQNARNITQEVPMYTQGAFQSLLRSWTLNYRDSLLKVTFWREVGQLSQHLILDSVVCSSGRNVEEPDSSPTVGQAGVNLEHLNYLPFMLFITYGAQLSRQLLSNFPKTNGTAV